MKVGVLAQRTGLTVRTLHHYDEIGVLKPSSQTASGHRLYTASDIARLQQILSLKQIGFSLSEIRDLLQRPDFAPLEVIDLHLARLREQLHSLRAMYDRLEVMAARFQTTGNVSVDEFLQIIEMMTMLEKHYTTEQQEQLQKRAGDLGPDAIRKASEDWAELIELVRTEMEQGTDPASPDVQALAKRWMDLVEAFTGGDAGIEQSVKNLWDEEGDSIIAQHGDRYDPRPVSAYISKAVAAAEESA